MNRLFGRAKPKEPPPSITDCIAGVRFPLINRPIATYRMMIRL